MTQLLVSVRSVAEADTALAGCADVIDIKEPARGALGRADDAVIHAVAEHVAERKPVSAALGELCDEPRMPSSFPGLLKIGLAECATLSAWRERLREWSPLAPLGRGETNPTIAHASR